MNTNPKQTAVIQRHLEQGRAITPLEALDLYGCARLGARIWELRKAGVAILKRMVRVVSERTGRPCRVAEYRLASPAN